MFEFDTPRLSHLTYAQTVLCSSPRGTTYSVPPVWQLVAADLLLAQHFPQCGINKTVIVIIIVMYMYIYRVRIYIYIPHIISHSGSLQLHHSPGLVQRWEVYYVQLW